MVLGMVIPIVLKPIYLVWMIFSFNKRAIQVYERVGFVCEGTLRQTQYNNGAYHDDIVMSVLRDEWKTNEADRPDR